MSSTVSRTSKSVSSSGTLTSVNVSPPTDSVDRNGLQSYGIAASPPPRLCNRRYISHDYTIFTPASQPSWLYRSSHMYGRAERSDNGMSPSGLTRPPSPIAS